MFLVDVDAAVVAEAVAAASYRAAVTACCKRARYPLRAVTPTRLLRMTGNGRYML